MLACVGLWISLSVYNDYRSKIEGPIDINVCHISRMYERKAEYSQKLVCNIFFSSGRFESEKVAETCEEVKAKIKASVMVGPK